MRRASTSRTVSNEQKNASTYRYTARCFPFERSGGIALNMRHSSDMSGNHRLSNTSISLPLQLVSLSLPNTRAVSFSLSLTQTHVATHVNQERTLSRACGANVRPLSQACRLFNLSLICFGWPCAFAFLSFCLMSWCFFSSLYCSYLTNAAWSSRQPTRKCPPSLVVVSEETRRDAVNACHWRKQLPVSSAVPSLSCTLNCADRQRWAMFYRRTLRNYHTWIMLRLVNGC